jgi:cyclophilin family peptidyl-prolyl cis-trans isomerase
VPEGGKVAEFVGTPLVVEARTTPKFQGPLTTVVIHVEPLSYAKMTTNRGEMTIALWYDVAPNTVASFMNLSSTGYYNGLYFHRIVPDFVIQGGDPTGTGFGGPGYQLPAEFNDRPHEEGVLSMARTGDPFESKGIPPRPEWANSAGSQFFICLTREKCATLDKKYTGFGKVFEGLDTVKAIASASANGERPSENQIIQKVEILPVTAKNNPYREMLKLDLVTMDSDIKPTPATQPVK